MSHPLAPLLAYRQWILVKLVPLPNGKTDKLPLDPRTGNVTLKGSDGAHNPAVWLTYEAATAAAALMGPAYTVGFVITAADPFWCLDIDGALQADGQTWSPLALELMKALPGTAREISQSGRGLHLWGQGPVPDHSKKNDALHIELYSERRFIAIGHGAVGDMSQPELGIAYVAQQLFPPRVGAGVVADEGPCPEWRGPEDDDELLRRALQSRSMANKFGGGKASFADLFCADEAVLSKAFPPDGNSSDAWGRSNADAALAQHLAFWTGRDVARIERLMRRSKLVREKWDREDYLVDRTIMNACRLQKDVLQDKPEPESPFATAPLPPAGPTAPPAPGLPPPPPEQPGLAPARTAPTAEMRVRTDEQAFLGADAQRTLFSRCVYVIDHHRVMVPGGRMLKPDQFRAAFGGKTFVMDAQNSRTTRNAFEAFTESQLLQPPIVDGTCFRPDLPYGAIIESEGRTRANQYWPANVRRVKGDITPFLRHLSLVLPNERDRNILLYYMAGCVQFAGHKFQWFPLLVGVEGNGKSLFSRCVAAAVGQRYTHWPAANKLGKDFNAWVFGKLFFAIEDLQIGDAIEVWEKLKPLITGENLEIEAKGVDQRTDEICGNFMANSNHENAVRKTANDRRVAHIRCAQTEVHHLIRDGMTEAYMGPLYDWLKREDGYAIVAEYLHTLVIPDAYGLKWLMGRAPRTSSTDDAVAAGLGRVEQEILEAVGNDESGFRGGWISSVALARLLERLGKANAIAPNKQRSMLQSLGYDWHASLPDGRSHNAVLPDGAKARLYLLRDHPARAFTVPGDIARAYTAAQTVPVPR